MGIKHIFKRKKSKERYLLELLLLVAMRLELEIILDPLLLQRLMLLRITLIFF